MSAMPAEYRVRVELVELLERSRKNGKTPERVLESFEVDVEDQADGVELMSEIESSLEEDGLEIEGDE